MGQGGHFDSTLVQTSRNFLILVWDQLGSHSMSRTSWVRIPCPGQFGFPFDVQDKLVSHSMSGRSWCLIPCPGQVGFPFDVQDKLVSHSMSRTRWFPIRCPGQFGFPFNVQNKLVSHSMSGRLVSWGLTPQQQPGSYQGGEMMMMKSVIWWRKPEYPEETTYLRQVTDETFHTYGLCPVRGLNLGRSGVKQSELRHDESGALAHRATAVPEVGVSFHVRDKLRPWRCSGLTIIYHFLANFLISSILIESSSHESPARSV